MNSQEAQQGRINMNAKTPKIKKFKFESVDMNGPHGQCLMYGFDEIGRKVRTTCAITDAVQLEKGCTVTMKYEGERPFEYVGAYE